MGRDLSGCYLGFNLLFTIFIKLLRYPEINNIRPIRRVRIVSIAVKCLLDSGYKLWVLRNVKNKSMFDHLNLKFKLPKDALSKKIISFQLYFSLF